MKIAIKELVDRLRNMPDYFALNEQKTSNLEEYFGQKYDCTSFPKGFLQFYKETDGITIGDVTLFAVNENSINYVLLFDEYASKDETKKYLERIVLDGKDDLMFFANDGEGGRFAFGKKEDSDKVYYLSMQRPEITIIYDSFYDWLKNLVDVTIKDKIESLKND